MACSVRFAREAQRNAGDIVDYLLNVLESRQAASHFLDSLEAAVQSIAIAPESFPLCEEDRLASLGYRKIIFMNYIALYRMEDETAIIVHVFHQTQDYARLV